MPINQTEKTIFIVAGEDSGDLHGAKLVSEIKKIAPTMNFIGHGGDRMAAAGVKIIEHVSRLSMVGLTEVIMKLPHMMKVMNRTIRLIKDTQPDRIILIDYPGFNLRLAKKIKSSTIPITYFILPQVWAWGEKRIYKIQKYIDQAISIIPFEKDWFKVRGISINYVGHPFADKIEPTLTRKEFFSKHTINPHQPILTLLPGSRQSEINRHWPIFLDVIHNLRQIFPNMQFVVGRAPNISFKNKPNFIQFENNDIRSALAYGTAGLIASGTATLEAVVYGLPCVVCYKTSNTTYWLGKNLTKVKYIALANLIGGQQIVHEFIQNKMTFRALSKALIPLLSETEERKKMLSNYKKIINRLGPSGVYQRAAQLIINKI